MLFFRNVAIFLSNRVTTFFYQKHVLFCIHYKLSKIISLTCFIGTVMQIEKALINDRLRVSKVR